MKKIIETSKAPAPVGPYSQAVEINHFIYCSGQIPLDADSGELELGDIQKQTEKVMKNIEAVLKASDVSFSQVIKTAIFLTDMGDFQAMNEVYSKYFPEKSPARSCVAVSQLPKGVNVEIEVIAHR